MTVRYLIDTNVLSEPMLQQPNIRVVQRLQREHGQIAIAAPVFHELLFGAQRLPPSRRRSDLEDYLSSVIRRGTEILPYDAIAAEWHANERARLVGVGRTPPYVDGQIAAIAATNGLTLITYNVRDFQAFDGLQIEDWRE